MSLKKFNNRFWLITAVSAIAVAVTLKLGFWQLSRAHEKLSLQSSLETQAALPSLTAEALNIASTRVPSAHLLHRRITLTGHWLPQYTLFLDNRQMDNKPGVFVLTPFEFIEPQTLAKKIILVQRGWAPRNFLDRNALPKIKTETDQVTISGRMTASPSKLFEFKSDDTGALRQNVETEVLAKEFKLDLLPYTLLQQDDSVVDTATDKRQEQLLRHWPQPNVGADKNYGYMVQWWALSVLVTVLYVWFQWIRPNFKSKSKTEE